MKNIRELEIKITADTSGLRELGRESKKVSERIDKNFKGAVSTHEKLNQTLGG